MSRRAARRSTLGDMGNTDMSTSRTRAFTFPEPGDTLATMAARLLPAESDGEAMLLGWNPHLALRTAPGADGLLSTDIVYTEPPP
jgi:hypothetical protein